MSQEGLRLVGDISPIQREAAAKKSDASLISDTTHSIEACTASGYASRPNLNFGATSLTSE